MDFDATILSRVQFALNISFHYLYPPMSIGLGFMLVFMEGMYLATKRQIYKDMAKFFTKIFGLFFAMGVATGIVMIFAFGTNWSNFSKFVGNIFGSLLAAEGVFAFFLEGGFLGLMLFGWDRVKPWLHYLATCLVVFGAHFSAIWIVMANSWMQTPAGYRIVGSGSTRRAVITDVWDVYLNPSALTRIGHVVLGAWILGAFLVMSISAYYLIKKRHLEMAEKTFRFSLAAAVICLLLQLWSGDSSARGAAEYQPAKLAAMEGVFKTVPDTPFTPFGWVDMEKQTVVGPKIPGLLSVLTYHNFSGKAVPGLDQISKDDWPNVQATYQCYHAMIWAWGLMMLVVGLGTLLWILKKLNDAVWFLWIAVFAIFLPYIGNLTGWYTAELGRQPWVVWHELRTVNGSSPVLVEGQLWGSIIMFIAIYALSFILFLYLLNLKIQAGPTDQEGGDSTYSSPQTHQEGVYS